MKCIFNTVRERDMDLLFMESMATDTDFLKMILEEAALPADNFRLISVQLSKTELDLGESDITAVIETDGKCYGILIEDKIDAIAMENQYGRYKERGKIGIKNGEYADFRIFMFSPQKYHDNNREAIKYDYFISYEKHLEYFQKKDDPISNMRCQQLEQAINKAKNPSNVTLNEMANAYFCRYRDYQKTHYPTLDLRTKEGSNGYWVQYATRFGKTYILHKTQEGFVDLTFPNTATALSTMEKMAEWLQLSGMKDVFATLTGKSASLRITVPQLSILEDFNKTPEHDLEKCFEAIKKLHELAGFLGDAAKLGGIK